MFWKKIASVLVVGAVSLMAAPGALDLSFGNNGKVITKMGERNEMASSMVIQNNGKIVVGGNTYSGQSHQFAVARYFLDGSLDIGYGSNGKVLTDLTVGTDRMEDMALQSDGKIIAVGAAANMDFGIVRYSSDGTLDAGFGTGGIVITDIGAVTNIAYAVAVQNDGKIVVAGFTIDPVNLDHEFAIVRYETDGTLDMLFGNGGKVVTDLGGGIDVAEAVVIQDDGKILVAGSAENLLSGYREFATVRYNSNGTLDMGFGNGGVVRTPVGSENAFASSMALQSDGKTVVAGRARNPESGNVSFALVRYLANGGLDQTFGVQGKVMKTIGSVYSAAYDIAVQPNGKILAVGEAVGNISTTYDFAIVRYRKNGSLDQQFGSSGKVFTDINNSGTDIAHAVAIQEDGRIVVAGSYHKYGSTVDYTYFAVTRYEGRYTTVGVRDSIVPRIDRYIPFDTVNVGESGRTEWIKIRNTRGAPLHLGTVSLSDMSHFTIENDECSQVVLAEGEVCKTEVKFTPQSACLHSAELEIHSDGKGGDISVKLEGVAKGDSPNTSLRVKAVSSSGSIALKGKTLEPVAVQIYNKGSLPQTIEKIELYGRKSSLFTISTQSGGLLDKPYNQDRVCGPLPHRLNPFEGCLFAVGYQPPNNNGRFKATVVVSTEDNNCSVRKVRALSDSSVNRVWVVR